MFKTNRLLKFSLALFLITFLVFNETNLILAADGDAQWARSTIAGAQGFSDYSNFGGSAVDTSGNVYVAGNIKSGQTFNFGNGVTIVGGSTTESPILLKYSSSGDAQWAKTTSAGAPGSSRFRDLVVDSDGNIYAVGEINSTGSFGFGNGVTVAGGAATNVVVVKYNSSGVAQWAKSTSAGTSSTSYFFSVDVDTSGNVYAAGTIYTSASLDFGDGVTVSGGSSGDSVVIVKYNSSGVTQWARSTGPGNSDSSTFYGVTVDANGGVYAAGTFRFTNTFDFGDGVTVAGGSSSSNTVIVKYNSSGVAQWAKSTGAGAPDWSAFNGITSDLDGNVYAVGEIDSTGTFDFGDGVTVAGGIAAGNTVIVKYNSSGVAQWARSTEAGAPGYSYFNGAGVDSDGNVYAVGEIDSTDSFNFGNSVTVSGGYTSSNTVIVKYNSSGVAQWAKSTGAGAPAGSYLNDVASDINGNVYAVGEIDSTDSFNFGNSVTVSGGSSYNAVVIKYGGGSGLVPTPTPSGIVLGGANNSTAAPPFCSDPAPASAPDLFQINTTKNSATLFFAPAKDPVNKYHISYGESKDNMLYGVEYYQGHSDGVLSYTINLLSPNTDYYFKIRAGNGNMPGPWSNVVKVRTSSSKQIWYENQSSFERVIPKNSTSMSVTPAPASKTAKILNLSTPTPVSTLSPTLVPTAEPQPTNNASAKECPPGKKFCILWWCF